MRPSTTQPIRGRTRRPVRAARTANGARYTKAEARETIGVQESNINVSEASRTDPDPTELVPLHLENGTGILFGADADSVAIRAALAGQPVAVRETTAGPYPLLATAQRGRRCHL